MMAQTQNAMGTMTTAVSPRTQWAGAEALRVTQVDEQLTALSVNAQDLGKMVATLEERLQGVTQPRSEANNKLSAPEPVLVPLAGRIKELVDSIRGSVDRLRELSGAIELP